MRAKSLGAIGSFAWLLLAPVPLQAHHSTAEFDYSKTVTISGVVKEVQWTNPHSYIQLIVTGPNGQTEQWGVEIGAPALNIKLGWRMTSVKPGDKITMNVAPSRKDNGYATLRYLTFEDGRRLNGVAASVKSDIATSAAPK